MESPLIGVLALQGDFEAHGEVLARLGARVREIRAAAELDGIDGLVLPGGESTTMTLGIERERLVEPLRALVSAGTPVLGTCAGLIVLDRDHLGLLDVTARRNAFGRQVRSFEVDLDLAGLGIGDGAAALTSPGAAAQPGDAAHPSDAAHPGAGPAHPRPLRAVFIRAPWVEDHGERVEVLAEVGDHPVAVRQGSILAVAFHTEIAGESRLHEWLLAQVAERNGGRAQ